MDVNDAAALLEDVAITEPIRLVIWDLDDTFWRGTLTEGGIQGFIASNHDLVRDLARRGIVSSICSKNDHDTIRGILTEQGLWDSFIFPSIDWSPKGGRIAAMIDAIGLRPPTVLFIDDNPNNRGEAAATVPGLVVASERFIPQIAGHPMFRGKDDSGLTRLAQYKLLEQKQQDAVSAPGSNTDFLRSCQITVTIEHDVEQHLDRVVELINRTNQLNFTKRRLPDDPAEATAEALRQIRYYNNQAGLVRVRDRYGDYGFVGFYLNKTMLHEHPPGELEHFCFSCRTIGMGIEQYVYQTLGKPWLWPVGEVLSDVKDAPPADWINQAAGTQAAARTGVQFTEIRLRGGCEMSALAHYFRIAGAVRCVETNFRNDMFLIRQDTAANLANLLTLDTDQVAGLARLEFPAESLRSDFLAPVTGPTLLVADFWGDLHGPFYRHKRSGFMVHILPLEYLDWTEAHVGGDIAAWTDAELAERADLLNLDSAMRARVGALVAELRANYEFGGQVGEREVKANIRVITDALPAGATLAVILPTRIHRDGTPHARNIQYGEWCAQAVAGRANVQLIEIDHSIHSLTEHAADLGDHFDRIVYARVAEDVLGRVKPGETRPAAPPSSFPQFPTAQPLPYAQTTAVAASRPHPHVVAINRAFEDAMALRSRLPEAVLQIQGFAGRKFRMLLNNLVGLTADPRYLEIGVLHGASFCAAIHGNTVRAVGIDNWSEYGGTPEAFGRTLDTFKPADATVTILPGDFRTVGLAAGGPYNVLFFDGSHGDRDRYDGIAVPHAAMDDHYVLVVADWNWQHVRTGTLDALRDVKARVDFQLEVRTAFFDEHLPLVHGMASEWHNGCLIAAVSKR